MRMLGLDIGRRRIGVALSDPTRLLAQPLKVIERTSKGQILQVLKGLAREWEIEKVIVGYPRQMSGEVGEEAKWVESYAEELGQELGLPIVLWDERLSTVSAERLLRERGWKRGRRRDWVDAVAAAVILQDYLDSHNVPGRMDH